MAETNDTENPDGVVIQETSSSIQYTGNDATLIAAGIVLPEWITDLGRWTKVIVLDVDNGFLVLKDGKKSKKGRLDTNENRAKGLVSILRLLDGYLTISKYRTVEEKHKIDAVAKIEFEKRMEGWRLEREEEEKKEKADRSYKPQSSGEFRNDCDRMFKTAMSVINAYMEEGGFVYTNESLSKINHAFSDLRSVLTGGGIQAKPSLQRDGNVVYLNSPLRNAV